MTDTPSSTPDTPPSDHHTSDPLTLTVARYLSDIAGDEWHGATPPRLHQAEYLITMISDTAIGRQRSMTSTDHHIAPIASTEPAAPDLQLGGHRIVLEGDVTITALHDGATIVAAPEPTDEYRARAADLGYGDDVLLMSQEHEIGHAVIAALLRLPESPTLRGVADRAYWPHWRVEEGAVLELQRMCRSTGTSMMDVAQRLSAALTPPPAPEAQTPTPDHTYRTGTAQVPAAPDNTHEMIRLWKQLCSSLEQSVAERDRALAAARQEMSDRDREIAALREALKLAELMLTKDSLCQSERLEEGLTVIRRARRAGGNDGE